MKCVKKAVFFLSFKSRNLRKEFVCRATIHQSAWPVWKGGNFWTTIFGSCNGISYISMPTESSIKALKVEQTLLQLFQPFISLNSWLKCLYGQSFLFLSQDSLVEIWKKRREERSIYIYFYLHAKYTYWRYC